MYRFPFVLGLLPALLLVTTTGARSDEASAKHFAFQPHDRVAIIGNGLPDRMQHDGWFETLMQAQLKGKQVRFRNLGFSADTVDKAPRGPRPWRGGSLPKEVPGRRAYLKKVKADVIFTFFGYNESYTQTPAEFEQKLVNRVKALRELKPNGKSEPRIVLFSPIAFEDTGDPHLPDETDRNARLEGITDATRRAAEPPRRPGPPSSTSSTSPVSCFKPTTKLTRSTACT